MSDIYESITLDLDKITDERIRRIVAATDELMDEKLASIGYVKVVRCRDCKHATPDTSGRKYYEGYLWCDELTEGIGFSVAPSDFCAWGERGDA